MTRAPRSAGWLVAVVLAASCSPVDVHDVEDVDDLGDARWAELGRSCPEDAPATLLSEERRDSLPPFERDLNGQWADFALRAPGGVGGYFIGEAGPTLYLTDTTQLQAAAAFLREEGVPVADAVVARQGRWDFAQLYDWYRYLNRFVFALDGWSTADVNEATNRLEYGAVDESARREIEDTLRGLGIVPCFLVAIELQARPEMRPPPISLDTRARGVVREVAVGGSSGRDG